MGLAKSRRNSPLARIRRIRTSIYCCAVVLGCCGYSLDARAQAPAGLCTTPPWWWIPESSWASWWLPAGCPKPPLPGSARIVSGGNTFGFGPPPLRGSRMACGWADNSHSAPLASPVPHVARRPTNERFRAASEPDDGPPVFNEDRGGAAASRLK